MAPYYGHFRQKIDEKTVIFCRFFAENDQSESPGVLIKSGVLYVRLRYLHKSGNPYVCVLRPGLEIFLKFKSFVMLHLLRHIIYQGPR